MGHMLAKCRIIRAIAVLALAVLALMVVAGVPVMGHASIAQAQTMTHQHHDYDLTGVPLHGGLHQQAIHSDLAQCCHDEPAVTDCASICAAMAGCQLQMMPGELLIDIVLHDASLFIGSPAFHAEFSAAPATPPPKAWI